MTRKDYIALAATIRATAAHQATDDTYREGWQSATSALAHRIADVLAADNARFNRSFFFKACGITTTTRQIRYRLDEDGIIEPLD